MSTVFEMAEQIQPITYDQALLMYNLGFTIQIEAMQNGRQITTVMDENSVEQNSLENRLIEMGILDNHLQEIKPVKFYADLHLLKHCGLHIEYRTKQYPTIEYAAFEDICAKLLKLNREHQDLNKYVSNGIAYVTI